MQATVNEPINRHRKYEPYVAFLLLSVTMIDYINGFFIYEKVAFFGFSFGQITRILFFLFNVFILSNISKTFFKYLILTMAFLSVSCVIMLVLNLGYSSRDTLDLKDAIQNYFYFFYVVAIIFLLIACLNRKVVTVEKMIRLGANAAFIAAILILFSNITDTAGFNNYHSDVNSRGYFRAINTTTASLIVGYGLSLHILVNKVNLMNITRLFAIAVSAFFIGTKSFLGALAVITLSYFLISRSFSGKKFIILLMLAVGAAFVYFNVLGTEQWQYILSRYNYFYRLYDGSIVTFLLSGRNMILAEAVPALKENPLVFFFGIPNEYWLVEMDFFDMIFYFGIVGITTVVLLGKWAVIITRHLFTQRFNSILYATFLCMVFVSFFSGHVLFTVAGGSAFAVILAISIYSYKTETEGMVSTVFMENSQRDYPIKKLR